MIKESFDIDKYEETQLMNFQQRYLQVPGAYGPCLNWTVGNPYWCLECPPGYILFLRNSTATLCGKNLTNDVGTQYCSITLDDYPNEVWINSTIWSYVEGQTDPDFISYNFTASNDPVFFDFCFDFNLYFQGEVNGTYFESCLNYWWPEEAADIYQTSLQSTLWNYPYCFDCGVDGWETEGIINYPTLGIQVGACIQNSTNCQYTQYYDKSTKTCKECTTLFPNCAACNATNCTSCLQGFYLNPSVYDYTMGKNRSMCVFNTCPIGQCNDVVLLICKTSTIPNCIQCYANGAQQTCNFCQKGYILSSDSSQCNLNQPTNNNPFQVNYYYISGPTTFDPNNLNNLDGLSPQTGFNYVQQAINAIFTAASIANSGPTRYLATVFLAKGDHFFFYCTQNYEKTITGKDAGPYLQQNDPCQGQYMLKQYADNDNIYITFQPMECSMLSQLNPSNDGVFTTTFNSLCVTLSPYTEQRPVINVNDAFANFNISGRMTFQNIIFSGLNALAVPLVSTKSFKAIPMKLCGIAKSPTGQDGILTLTKLSPPNFPFAYFCQDSYYQGSKLVTTATSTRQCNINGQAEYYNQQESTLGCYGQVNNKNFFKWDSQSSTYFMRRRVLFNLYGFSDYQSMRQLPPELNIINCTFQYFLDNYESLIYVETETIWKGSANMQILNPQFDPDTGENSDKVFITSQLDFYFANGQDRGAVITIYNSIFQYQRFCKGMIVYRAGFFDFEQRSLLNLTHLYMNDPRKQDNTSNIIIQNCQFINLNLYYNLTALANYQGINPTITISNNVLDPFNLPAFIHTGIILNFEDYGGKIEIVNSLFTLNMIFFPEVLFRFQNPNAQGNSQTFLDQKVTLEYKMTICDQTTFTDQYFFASGYFYGDDVEQFFDAFERQGPIYISRNRDQLIIRGNTFTNNIGTFGGAITINSPNWAFGKTPYVAIWDNIFQNNMAYLSGNAVYIRNTMVKPAVASQICGGVSFKNNSFSSNVGMKLHNGGAITAICTYLSDNTLDDYPSSSGYSIVAGDDPNNAQVTIQMISDYSKYLTFYKYKMSSESDTFINNYAGMKGTSIYVLQMSYISINNALFQQNGPVYSLIEIINSPYVQYLSNGFTITYRDNYCKDEIDYLINCKTDNSLLYWSRVQGTLYVGFCQQDYCLSSAATHAQQLLVTNSIFIQNEAGPIMDSTLYSQQTDPTATQIYIAGGLNNTLLNCNFTDNQATSTSYFLSLYSSQMLQFFPTNYFTSSTSTLIAQVINPTITRNFAFLQTNITQCLFLRNKNYQILGFTTGDYYSGSLISYINLAPLAIRFMPILNLQQVNFFENVFVGPATGLINVGNGILQMSQCNFTNNGQLTSQQLSYSPTSLVLFSTVFYFLPYSINVWQQFGMINIQGTLQFPLANYTHQFLNNTFKFIASSKAAAIFLNLNNQDALLLGNQYSFLFSSQGGQIVDLEGSQQRTTIMIQNDNFQYLFSLTRAAIVLAPVNPVASLIIVNSTFDKIYGLQNLAIFVSSIAKLYLNNVNFTQYPLPQGQNLSQVVNNSFSGNRNMTLPNLIDSYYYAQLTSGALSTSGVMYIEFTVNTQNLMFGGTVFQNLSAPFGDHSEIINCLFQDLKSINNVVLDNLQSKVRMYNDADRAFTKQNVGVRRNRAQQKAIISVQGGGTFYGQNITIRDNYAKTMSSGIYSSNSNLTLDTINFINNTCDGLGTLSIEQQSTFYCNYCQFIGNKANDSSGIFANSNRNYSSLIKNSFFANNTAVANLFNIFQSTSTLNNVTMLDNTASLVNNGITLITSTITIQNSLINNTNQTYISQTIFSVDTGFFNLNYKSALTISNTSIINMRGAFAGVIYATGSSSIALLPGTLFQNCYSFSGDTISTSLAQFVFINGTTFKNNANADLYIDQTPTQIYNSQFSGSKTQAIRMTYSTLYMQSNIISNATNYNIDGKGINCLCQNVTLINNTFQNLSAGRGGAIFLQSSNQNLTNANFNISGNIFSSNTAQQGGAVFFYDSIMGNFTNNTLIGNQAYVITPPTTYTTSLQRKGLAGGLYFGCFNEELLSLNQPCVLGVSNNVFQNNYAQNDGGALLWVTNPYDDLGGNTYQNNTAFYGGNVASFPSALRIQFISNGDYSNPYNGSAASSNNTNSTLRRNLQSSNSSQIPNLVPGQSFTFYVYILDQNGNVYTTDSSSKAMIVNNAQQTNSSNSTGLVTIFNGIVIAQQGVYKFINVSITATPGSQISLGLQIVGLQTYGNNVSFVDSPISFNASLRNCIVGEAYQADGSCQQCAYGTYLYNVSLVPTTCLDCPKFAICFGGYHVGPQPGYWRSSNISSNFMPCPNQGVCLGGTWDNPLGVCQTGYQGILCADCQYNFRMTTQFQCNACPDPTLNSIQIAFIGFAVILVIVFMVRSTQNSAEKKQRSPMSIYMKILANHFQLIAVISNIDYNWPSQIQTYQQGQAQVARASDNAISFDCFVMQTNTMSFVRVFPLYYMKLLVFAVIPILLAIADGLFWSIYALIKNMNKETSMNKFASALVVLLFLVHPQIASNMFQAFNCIKVDSDFRLKENINSICYQGEHAFFLYTIVIPSIVLWAFGIPIFGAYVLNSNKEFIKLIQSKTISETEQQAIIQVKRKYGFLFQGYITKTYYWEIIIMVRKVSVIMATVFVSTLSAEMQVLIVFFIIAISLALQIRLKPFFNDELNKMETYSLIVAAATLYTGMFYVTGQHYTYLQNPKIGWAFLGFMSFPNIVFFVYWIYCLRIEFLKSIYPRLKSSIWFQRLACMTAEQFYEAILKPEEEREKTEQQEVIPDASVKKVVKKKEIDEYGDEIIVTVHDEEEEEEDLDESGSKEGEQVSQDQLLNSSQPQSKFRGSHRSNRKDGTGIENDTILLSAQEFRQNQSSLKAKSSLMSQLHLDLSNTLKGKNSQDKVHPEKVLHDLSHEQEEQKTRITANTQRGLVKSNRPSGHSSDKSQQNERNKKRIKQRDDELQQHQLGNQLGNGQVQQKNEKFEDEDDYDVEEKSYRINKKTIK